MGIALVELGHFDQAMSQFKEAARLDPAYPWPYFQMGKALLGQGRDAEAMDEFRARCGLTQIIFKSLPIPPACWPPTKNRRFATANRAGVCRPGERFERRHTPVRTRRARHGLRRNRPLRRRPGGVRSAINIETAAGMKLDVASMQQRLRLYQNHQPWRESFLSTNLPLGNLPQN